MNIIIYHMEKMNCKYKLKKLLNKRYDYSVWSKNGNKLINKEELIDKEESTNKEEL